MEVKLIDWMPCVAEITFKCTQHVGCHEAFEMVPQTPQTLASEAGNCRHKRSDGTCMAAERLVAWYRANGHPFPWTTRGGVPLSVLRTPAEGEPEMCPTHNCCCGTMTSNFNPDTGEGEFTLSCGTTAEIHQGVLLVTLPTCNEVVRAPGLYDYEAATALMRAINWVNDDKKACSVLDVPGGWNAIKKV